MDYDFLSSRAEIRCEIPGYIEGLRGRSKRLANNRAIEKSGVEMMT